MNANGSKKNDPDGFKRHSADISRLGHMLGTTSKKELVTLNGEKPFFSENAEAQRIHDTALTEHNLEQHRTGLATPSHAAIDWEAHDKRRAGDVRDTSQPYVQQLQPASKPGVPCLAAAAAALPCRL